MLRKNILKYENMNETSREKERQKKIKYNLDLNYQIEIKKKMKEEERIKKELDEQKLEEKIKNDLKKFETTKVKNHLPEDIIDKLVLDTNKEKTKNHLPYNSKMSDFPFFNEIQNHNSENNKTVLINQKEKKIETEYKNNHLRQYNLPIIHTFNFQQIAHQNNKEKILMEHLKKIEDFRDEERLKRENLEKKIDLLNDIIFSKFRNMSHKKNKGKEVRNYFELKKQREHLDEKKMINEKENFEKDFNNDCNQKRNDLKIKNSLFQNYARNYLNNNNNINDDKEWDYFSAPKTKNLSCNKNNPSIKKSFFTPNLNKNEWFELNSGSKKKNQKFEPKNLFIENMIYFDNEENNQDSNDIKNHFLRNKNNNNITNYPSNYKKHQNCQNKTAFQQMEFNSSKLLDGLSNYIEYEKDWNQDSQPFLKNNDETRDKETNCKGHLSFKVFNDNKNYIGRKFEANTELGCNFYKKEKNFNLNKKITNRNLDWKFKNDNNLGFNNSGLEMFELQEKLHKQTNNMNPQQFYNLNNHLNNNKSIFEYQQTFMKKNKKFVEMEDTQHKGYYADSSKYPPYKKNLIGLNFGPQIQNESKSMLDIFDSNEFNIDNSINGALKKYDKLNFDELKKSINFDDLINVF